MDVNRPKRGWRDWCVLAIPALIILGWVGPHFVFQNTINIIWVCPLWFILLGLVGEYIWRDRYQ